MPKKTLKSMKTFGVKKRLKDKKLINPQEKINFKINKNEEMSSLTTTRDMGESRKAFSIF